MRYKVLVVFVISILTIFNLFSQTSTAPSGSGTQLSPYQIADFSNLLWITESSSRWGAHYEQTANIDASATSVGSFNSGAGWSPIGNTTTAFSGKYNGKQFKIFNLFINRYGSNNIGLFGITNLNALIQNLGIEGNGIYGNFYVGSLVGDNAGTINLCYATGNVTNNTNYSGVGGLVGNNTGTISKCYSKNGTITSVSGSSFAIGGLVGINTGTGLIEKSYSKCTVISPSQQAGGLVGRNGFNTGGTVKNCYATGNVSGTLYSGGLIGIVISGVIENCYSTGVVTISDPAAYAQAAGLIGDNSGTVTNCFWDTQTSGKATSSGGTGKTTAQMKTLTTFTTANWDFQLETVNGANDNWGMNCSDNNSYPFLSFEGYLGAGCNQVQWVGTISTNWAVAGNWSTNSVPTYGDITFSSSAVNDLALDQNRMVNSINFNGSNKKVVLNNFNLTLFDIVGGNASSYIKTNGTGIVSKNNLLNDPNDPSSPNSFDFPVGNSTYNPLHIWNTSNNAGNFSVRVIDNVFLNGTAGMSANSPVVNRTWQVSKSTANDGSGVFMAFNWDYNDVINGSLVAPKMNYFNGSSWTIPNINNFFPSSPNDKTLEVTSYVGPLSSSLFAISEGSSPLPIELTAFNANCTEIGTTINWQTASEHNSAFFDVEKSRDGINWSLVETVEASGNSTALLDYSVVDSEKATDVVYYRLNQVDQDGESKIYGPISATCFETTDFTATVFPNPASGMVTIEMNAPKAQTVSINICGTDGKAIEQIVNTIEEGTTQIPLSLETLKAGVYTLKVNGENEIKTIKMIVQ
jgi:hypothetical protein